MTTCFGTARPGTPVGPLSINYVINIEHIIIILCADVFFSFVIELIFFMVLNIIINMLLYITEFRYKKIVLIINRMTTVMFWYS